MTTTRPTASTRADTPGADVRLIVGASIAGLLLRWSANPSLPTTWDGVQYLLGVREFSPALHQPHPPGYFLFVQTARVAHALGLSEHVSLLAVSAVAGALLTALVVWWAGRLAGRAAAIAAAVLALSSPLLLQVASDERSYAAGALGSGAVGLLCWQARRARPWGGLFAGLALGLLAGYRLTDAVLLTPLWAWSLGRHGTKLLVWGLAGAAIAGAAWGGPFLCAAGGAAHLLEISGRLSSGITHQAPIAGDLGALPRHMVLVVLGAVEALGAGWVFVGRVGQTELRTQRTFLALWVAPALSVFLLGHVPAPVYMAVLVAPLLLVGAVGMGRWMETAASPRGRRVAVTAVFAANLAVGIPAVVVPHRRAGEDLQAIADACARWNRSDTVALTSSDTFGLPPVEGAYLPFRHAMYLLPEAHVFIFPLERVGDPGTMPNYGFRLHTVLQAPPKRIENVRNVLLLGRGLLQHLPPELVPRTIYSANGLELFHAALPAPSHVLLGANGALLLERCPGGDSGEGHDAPGGVGLTVAPANR